MINKINQSGRSMVEMLGVLAIIGVLSVGGIAGYTMAMNKHRANEILNAASVRAMVVSAKIQQNSGATIDTSTLAEFGSEKVQGVSFTDVSASGNNFTLTLSDVSAEACTQMKNVVGESGNVNIGDCPASGTGSVLLTYNADLSAPVNMTPGVPPADPDECDACSNAGKLCIKGTSNSDYKCVDKPTGCETCGPNQYCKYTSSSNCNQAPTTGECVNRDRALDNEDDTVTDETTTLYIGPSGVNWWTAKEYCEKFHTRLATIADFGCSADSVSAITSDGYGACYKEGTSGAMTDLFVAALAKNKYFWLNNSYNSCYAYSVDYEFSGVYGGGRGVDYGDALCR